METPRRAFSLLPWLFAVLVLGFAWPAMAGSRYVCPPCGSTCDDLVFDHPGTCPTCGMALVEAGTVSAVPSPPSTRVAILLFDGVEIIDSMGPYEVFGTAGFDVFTVAATKNPIRSAMGQTMVPKYSFADAPKADVLVVPGGGIYSPLHDPSTLQWVKEATAHTRYTMSVCNGAFILASAGLLDGLSATTTAHNIPKLRDQFPKVRVVDDQRVVDNGHIITTGGLSAGIDGALHVVELIAGKGEAQSVALSQEYQWDMHSAFTRATMADLLIPDVAMDSLGTWKVARTEGDAKRWNIELLGTSKLSADALLQQVGRELSKGGSWQEDTTSRRSGSTAWRFKGRAGEPWGGTLTIQPKGGQNNEYTVSLSIARVG